jgi:hypothetical protein
LFPEVADEVGVRRVEEEVVELLWVVDEVEELPLRLGRRVDRGGGAQ